jgi:hypothetical protein
MSNRIEVSWSTFPLSYPGGVRELESVMAISDVGDGEFVCRLCQRSMKAQRTLVQIDKIAGKERRAGAYCLKCAYVSMADKLRERAGGEPVAEAIRQAATASAIVDGELYVVIEPS